MKVRSGFVSNSSSCSFLIYGIHFDDSEVVRSVIQKGIEEDSELKESYVKYDMLDEDGKIIEDADIDYYDMGSVTGLSIYSPYGEGYYVGESWDSIDDDETGAQFKSRVQETIKKYFGEELAKKCSSLEEAWRDG